MTTAAATKIQESGNAGEPGATGGAATARNGAQNGKAPASREREKITLTSDGIASLLKSEFAAESAEAAPGQEIQPGTAETEALLAEGQSANAQEAQTAGDDTQTTGEQTETQTEETAEEQAAREAAEAAAAEGAQELPAELQSAIDEWEAQGHGTLPPVLQNLFDKRIGKITAQRESEKTRADAAEARVQELEEQVAQAPSGAATAAPDEKTLLARKQMFKTFLRDAVGYLEDTATDEERGRIEAYMQSNNLDATGLKRHVQQTREYLEDLPEQLQQVRTAAAQYRGQEQAAEVEAKKYFPWLDDKTSPQYQEAQKVLQAMPDLKQRTPLHKVVLGVYVLGLQAFKSMKAPAEAGNGKPTAARPKVVVKAPPKTPAAGAAAPAVARANGNAAAEANARQRFEKAPTKENVAELLKIGFRS